METKAEVLASIANGSRFNTAEIGRTARLKSERINQIAESTVSKILFVGPPRPIVISTIPSVSSELHGYDRGSGTYNGD